MQKAGFLMTRLISCFSVSKFLASSNCLWLYKLVVSHLVGNSKEKFSHDREGGVQINLLNSYCASVLKFWIQQINGEQQRDDDHTL